MKTIILSVLAFTSIMTASASSTPKCPAKSKTILKCKAVDRSSDQVLAQNFMDGAVVCLEQGKLSIILSLPESNSPSEQIPVKKILRAGATSYMADIGDIQFSLNRMLVLRKANATFEIYVGGSRAARTLACK